jgi:hypothetical protein
MNNTFADLTPLDTHPFLAWLGRRDWCRVERGTPRPGDPRPRTVLRLNAEAFADVPAEFVPQVRLIVGWVADIVHEPSAFMNLAVTECFAEALARGPKLFAPNAEQFEAMEHVTIDLPPRDFRAPFPALTIVIPTECRREFSRDYGVPFECTPRYTCVRYRPSTARSPSAMLMAVSPYRSVAGEARRTFTVVTDQPGNHTVEDVIRRDAGEDNPTLAHEHPWDALVNQRISRAAFNLCLLLANFGFRLTGMLDPAAAKKHRRGKGLERYRFGDFATVAMQQEVLVRAQPAAGGDDEPGPPTGREVRPHWRKGHWRRKPGWEAYVERQEPPPLVFVRPTLVRPDRAVGDPAHSTTTYRSKEKSE